MLDVVAENAARVCGATDAVNPSRRWQRTHTSRALWTGSRYAPRGSAADHPWLGDGSSRGRPTRQFTVHDVEAESESEFPECSDEYAATALAIEPYWPHRLLRDGIAIGVIHIRRMEVRPFTDRQIKLARNLRRSGRHRHRERALVQRTRRAQRGVARGAGASDGDIRGARHHQPLADGRAAGARRHRRERREGLRDR